MVYQNMSSIPVGTKLNLSANQLHIYYDLLINPNKKNRYILLNYFELAGQLDIDALEQAVTNIICSSSALQSTFNREDNDISFILKKDARYHMDLVDFSKLSNPRKLAQQKIYDENSNIQNVMNYFGFYIFLIRLEEDRYWCCCKFNHILIDGVSAVLFRNKIAEQYSNISNSNIVSQLPKSDWEEYNQSLTPPLVSFAHSITEPKNTRASSLAITEVRKDPESYAPARSRRIISPETALAVRNISDLNELGYAKVLTSFALLFFHKLTGQNEYTIGLPYHGRTAKSMRHLLGNYAMTLELTSRLNPKKNILDFLHDSNSALANAINSSNTYRLPMPRDIQKSNKPILKPSLPTILNVLPIVEEPSFSGIAVTTGENLPNFSENLIVWLRYEKSGDFISIQLDGNLELFSESILDGILIKFDLFIQSLVGIFEDGNRLKSACSQLAELSASLGEPSYSINSTLPTFPRINIQSCIEHVCRAHPLLVAIEDELGTITYSELHILSFKLANYLKKMGLNYQNTVCVRMVRSVDLIVSMLAIFKIGAIYVPIDSEQPIERINHITSDVQCSIFLTHGQLDMNKEYPNVSNNFSSIDCGLDANYKFFDPLIDAQNESFTSREPMSSLTDIAYIIYTSGSTGSPKGVPIQHRSLLAEIGHEAELFEICQSDRVLFSCSIGFDPSFIQVFLPLIQAATCVVLKDLAVSPKEIGTFIISKKVSVISFVPSILSVLLSYDIAHGSILGSKSSIRLATCGGEVLHPSLVKNFFTTFSADVKLFNTYGPTETTIRSTIFRVDPQESYSSIPIGHPTASTEILVCNSDSEILPRGISGELLIGGIGLSPGYLNCETQTEKSFVNLQAGATKTHRFYKTGDIVRMLDNGELEFIGRRDCQIKFRGYRIELEEIEYLLKANSSIVDCAVSIMVKNGNELMVAYLVCSDINLDTEIISSYFRNELAASLPTYMIPNQFHFVDSLPLNVNGKIDRRRLKDIIPRQPKALALRTPSTDIEISIKNIWNRILGFSDFGVDDDFFEIGGSSLTAMLLTSEIENSLGVNLLVTDVYKYPTVVSLSTRILQLLSNK